MIKMFFNKKILLSLLFFLIISFFVYFSNLSFVNASEVNSYSSGSLKYYYGPNDFILLNSFKATPVNSDVYYTHFRYKPLSNLEGTSYFKYPPFTGNLDKGLSYKFNLNSTNSDLYLSSLELYITLGLNDSYVNSQSTCEQRFTDVFLNFYVHQLWSFYIDYDYDIKKFEPIEWLSLMNSYDGNFHDYSTSEKILQNGDKTYREIIFSVTISPYYYSYDSSGNIIVDSTDYMSYITYNSKNDTCSGLLHYQFDFSNLANAHQVSLGSISSESDSYLQMNKFKVSTSSTDYYVLNDFERSDDLSDFEEVEEFPVPKATGVQAILNFFETAVENFKTDINLFFNRLKAAFISLFVPNFSVLTSLYNYLKIETDKQFGFLLSPIILFKDIISRFNNLSTSDLVINIPDIKVPNFDFIIIKKTSFSFSDLLNNNSTMNKLWTLYLDFVDVYLILAFINLSWNKLNSFFGGMVSENEYLSVEDVDSYDNVTGAFKGSTRRISTSKRKRRRIK